MAKHSAPQTVVVVPSSTTIIRPIAVSAEAYLGKLRAMTSGAPTPPGRHSR
ncbi:hypothetical protein EV188_11160 [Actinomycetospora succinea]|uniref:Uncharacterized protein n=1 Tax=Actinomycetospora succinea TaxID=663603 RepID=A0A4R6UP01_9PSEU|nr:hypothetical protein [Actinomycetospora succinea]TDQ48890.1 hypothetical protein EV188_11160 [Actinomycetospora succinea]